MAKNRTFLSTGRALEGKIYLLLLVVLVISVALGNQGKTTPTPSPSPTVAVPVQNPQANQLDNPASVRRLIPTSPTTGDLMIAVYDPELERILKKFEAAVTSDKEWFISYRLEHTGQLPWHPRMGITKQEYVYLESHGPKLQKSGEVSFSFEEESANVFRLQTNSAAIAHLNGTVLNLNDNTVQIKSDLLDDYSLVNNDDENAMTGQWTGFRWKFWQLGEREVAFGLGALTNNPGQGLLYYDLRDISAGKTQDSIIFFNLPDAGR